MTLLHRIAAIVAPALLIFACQSAPHAAPALALTDISAADITFESGGVTLAATILTPKSGNATGVVMLPGSGPAERATIRPAAEEMAKLGAAVLIFDKRGSGASAGDWKKSSLSDLATDAINAMTELKTRAGVKKVGLWAHSQGNWVATRAAALGAKPDFLIAVSGGGAAPREVERYGYHHSISGFSPEDQAAAMSLVGSYFDYLSGMISRADLDQLIEPIIDSAWYAKLGISRVLISETYRDQWKWVAEYDPATGAENRNFPVIVLLGGADHIISLDLTITDWNRQLASNNENGHRIVTFVGRDHHLRDPDEGHGQGVSTEAMIWNEIALWLSETVLPR